MPHGTTTSVSDDKSVELRRDERAVQSVGDDSVARFELQLRGWNMLCSWESSPPGISIAETEARVENDPRRRVAVARGRKRDMA